MKKVLAITGLLCITLLFNVVACKEETITTTVDITSTVTQPASTITQTLPFSIITSTVTSTLTSTKTITATSSSSTSTSTTTSPQTVTTTEYTIVDGLITSLDGKAQILSHRMDYGITPGVQGKIKNLSTSVINAEIVIEVVHTSYVEQLSTTVTNLQPGATKNFSITITGYYDTTYRIIVLRTIA